MASYRCDACGNKTRFDVYESKRVRAYYHFTLAGEPTVEEEEVLDHSVERVVCRWCGAADAIVAIDPSGGRARNASPPEESP